MNTTEIKPQAAIDLGLLNRQEAANYLGMGLDAFKVISGRIQYHRLGAKKYYTKKALLDYLANIQFISKTVPQPLEN